MSSPSSPSKQPMSVSEARTELALKQQRVRELERTASALRYEIEGRQKEITSLSRPQTPNHPLRSSHAFPEAATPEAISHRTVEADIMSTPVFQRLQGQLRAMRKANQVLEKRLTSDMSMVIGKLQNDLKVALDERTALERELVDVESQKERVNELLTKRLGDDKTGLVRVEQLRGEIQFLQSEVGRLQHELDSTRQANSARENHDIHMARVLGAIWTNIKSRTARPKEEWDEDVKDVTRRVNRLLDSLEQENAMLSAAKMNSEAEVVEMADAKEVLVMERDEVQKAREAEERKTAQVRAGMRRQIAELQSSKDALEEKLLALTRELNVAKGVRSKGAR
ncbi:hypothetical protein J8273_3771 [Carpediemonas membranifera]|uniref:Uncharacterized protein n=1 Tax=Carpediemonas membranifera TaxID=201153 RepID=A0A8J6E099_9EUKA|nr:hypothetical protein J8273_3771 [Carpediemonas membranifera]|eukprot:KAG9394794.1 hypothetical protein J8273_3771 [Carpediemonas membranifera]